MHSNTQYHFLALISCILLTCFSYYGNSDHQLLHWDDITYITTNPWVTDPSWSHIVDIFTSYHLLNWHPFTWLSYIPEFYFCGDTASCYKSTNIGLHAVNSFLVYYLCWLMITTIIDNIQPNQFNIFIASIISGSLFAVHTLHVESVIWASERKDLLGGMFFLLSLIFYIRMHTERETIKDYVPFVFYCCSLFSKPIAITLPLVIVLLDIYPLQRFVSASLFRRFQICFIEKLHYYITAIAVSALTIISQDVIKTAQPPIIDKITIIISAVQHYLISFFYPFNLSPFYPVEILNTTSKGFLYLFCIFSMLFIVGLIIKKQKILLLIISYFLITLLPVIGIIKVGDQIYADRYTYLSMIGFYMIAGWIISDVLLKKGSRYRIIVINMIPIIIIYLAYNTHQYKNIWRSDLSLWEHVVSKYPNISSTAHQNLGNSYYEHKMYRDALVQYIYATDLNKHNLSACSNLSLTYSKLDNIERSLSTHELCVSNNPDNPMAYIQAGDAFYAKKQYKRAFDYYKHSIDIEPNYPYGLLRLGKLFIQLGDIDQSIRVLNIISSDSHVSFEANLLLAQAYANNDKDIALDILIKLKEAYGNEERIEQLIDKLKSLNKD